MTMANAFLEVFVGENSVIWHLKGAFYLGNKEKKRAVLDRSSKNHLFKHEVIMGRNTI